MKNMNLWVALLTGLAVLFTGSLNAGEKVLPRGTGGGGGPARLVALVIVVVVFVAVFVDVSIPIRRRLGRPGPRPQRMRLQHLVPPHRRQTTN